MPPTPTTPTTQATQAAPDYATRDAIVGVTVDDYRGGCASFDGLTLDKLTRLVDLGLADPEDAQNYAPTLGEILRFMRAHPRFTAHGYVVHPSRADVRVSLEGVTLDETPTDAERAAFVETFRHADDFQFSSRCYAWFD